MIPKVIHYCWFGGNPKPQLVQQCIASWKQYCPDYEIVEWNEDNFDVNCIPYTAEAYVQKKWAFVSDYARLKVVWENGGIYLDTDVLLHNSLDELLQYDCWLAQENIQFVSTGLGFGARKEHPLIQSMMVTYQSASFSNIANTELDVMAIEQYLTNWIKKEISQIVNGVYLLGLKDYSAFARHLGTISWADPNQQLKRAKQIEQMLSGKKAARVRWSTMIYRLKRKLHSPKIVSWMDKHKGARLERIYNFLTNDLLDYGPIYFIKRLIRKIFK